MKFTVDSEISQFRYLCRISLASEIFAMLAKIPCIAKGRPVIFVYLIPNDPILVYYHYSPYVISYFRCFSIFTHLGWLYKLPYKFVTLTFNLSVDTRSFSFSFPVFSLLSLLSLTFLGAKHPSRMTTWRMSG